jgi:hypothetical protein
MKMIVKAGNTFSRFVPCRKAMELPKNKKKKGRQSLTHSKRAHFSASKCAHVLILFPETEVASVHGKTLFWLWGMPIDVRIVRPGGQ